MLAAAPQVLDNPCCDFIDKIDWWVFLLIHIVLFVLGAYLAWRAFSANESSIGWGFSLYALGEISYMTYHINITRFLFAHTLSEVLVAIGLLMIFSGLVKRGIASWSGAGTGTMTTSNR